MNENVMNAYEELKEAGFSPCIVKNVYGRHLALQKGEVIVVLLDETEAYYATIGGTVCSFHVGNAIDGDTIWIGKNYSIEKQELPAELHEAAWILYANDIGHYGHVQVEL